jgi:hypothetical protein
MPFSFVIGSGKVGAVKAAMPKIYNVNKPGGLLNALLSALGIADQTIADNTLLGKANVFLETAVGSYLDVIGSNYGVARPSSAVSDATYRNLIRDIAWQPHSIIKIFRTVLTDFLGPSDGSNWDVFQIVPAQVIIQIRTLVQPRTLVDATYLHNSDSGVTTSTGVNFLTDSTKFWTVNEWAGFLVYDSTGTPFTITSNTSTTLTIVGTPAAAPSHYDILRTDVSSYPGDYEVNDETVLGSTVGGNIVILADDVELADLENTIELVIKAAGIQIVFDTSGIT